MVLTTNLSARGIPGYVVAIAITLAYIADVVRWLLSRLGLAQEQSISVQEYSPELSSSTYISSFSVSSCEIKDRLGACRMASFADGFCEDVICAICLTSVDKHDKIWQLFNCRHIFHMDCLDKWIENSQNTCPLCRSSLTPP